MTKRSYSGVNKLILLRNAFFEGKPQTRNNYWAHDTEMLREEGRCDSQTYNEKDFEGRALPIDAESRCSIHKRVVY
jgi:hypothetical protein